MVSRELDRLLDLLGEVFPKEKETWLAEVHSLGIWEEVCHLADAYTLQNQQIDQTCQESGGISNYSLADREQLWLSRGGLDRFSFSGLGLERISNEAWAAFAALLTTSEHAYHRTLALGRKPELAELWDEHATRWHERLEKRFSPVRVSQKNH